MIRRLTATPSDPPETYSPPPDRIVAGHPTQRLWSQYTDASGKFFAGVWESEPGRWKIRYTEEEYCRILGGRGRLEATDGSITVTGIPRGMSKAEQERISTEAAQQALADLVKGARPTSPDQSWQRTRHIMHTSKTL